MSGSIEHAQGPWGRLDFCTGLPDAPSREWHQVQLTELDVVFYIRVGLSEGQLICTGLHIDAADGAVTSRVLREIHHMRLLEMIGQGLNSPGHPLLMTLGIRPGWAQEIKTPRKKTKLRRGPKGYNDAHYSRAAGIYRRALVTNPQNPMQTTASELSASVATARRWIAEAERRNLLRLENTPSPRKAKRRSK